MKATLLTYLRAQDLGRLETSFELLANAAPAGYADWSTIARRGAAAARAGDLRAVKSQCTACHAKNRNRFRFERRLVPLVL